MKAVFRLFVGLAATTLLGACATAPPVRIGAPRILVENHQLVPGTELGSSEVEVGFTVLEVPEPRRRRGGHYLRSTLFVQRAEDDSLVATLDAPVAGLPVGTSRQTARFEVDAEALGIEPGAYTVQPVLLVGKRRQLERSLEDLFQEQATRPSRRFALAIGKDVGLQVLDAGDEGAGRYRALIDSGDPNLVYRGLSQLVLHHRARGGSAAAEKAVREVTARYATDAGVDRFRSIFLSWAADDIADQGDYERAAGLLRQERARAAASGFLGEPFGARSVRQEAEIWRRAEEPERELAAWGELIADYSYLDSWPEARAERAAVHLRAGDLSRAREDFAVIAAAAARCLEGGGPGPEGVAAAAVAPPRPPDSTGCPPAELVALAARHLAILDSDRGWYRSGPGPIVAEIRQAFAERNIVRLDRVASAYDFKYGHPGGHYQRAEWQGKIRSFFEHLLETRELTFNDPVLDPTIPGRLLLQGTDPDAPAGEATTHLFVVERTPYGWQWGAVGQANFPASLDKLLDDAAGDGGSGGGGGGSGAGERKTTPSSPQFKAPWAPGTRMRAGGLPLSFEELMKTLTLEGIIETLVNIFLSIDRCGAGVPGLFYNMPTSHTGQSYYAIDYSRGARFGCLPGWLGGKCAPNTPEAIAELTTALSVWACQKAGACDNTPIQFGAYLDPVHAAHAGVVIRRRYDQPNGDKETANRLEMAVWVYPPTSAVSVATQTLADPAADPALRELQSDPVPALNRLTPKPDYWVRYLHLARRGHCPGCVPSLGMWVPQGQLVGLVDDTGDAFISHLHFDARRRPDSDADANNGDRWMTAIQHIEGEFVGHRANGKCIRSSNKLDPGDFDDDGIPDGDDNCFTVANRGQEDEDGDGVGDACEVADRDNDGIPDADDSCPDHFDSPRTADVNNDGIPDLVFDTDGDGIGDACDPDIDGDGRPNATDQCPFGPDVDDLDGDGIPDACDIDVDGDGATNTCGFPARGAICPCRPDLDDFDPTRAGDHDGDGLDSLVDPCPCDDVNPGCIPAVRIDGAGLLQRYLAGG